MQSLLMLRNPHEMILPSRFTDNMPSTRAAGVAAAGWDDPSLPPWMMCDLPPLPPQGRAAFVSAPTSAAWLGHLLAIVALALTVLSLTWLLVPGLHAPMAGITPRQVLAAAVDAQRANTHTSSRAIAASAAVNSALVHAATPTGSPVGAGTSTPAISSQAPTTSPSLQGPVDHAPDSRYRAAQALADRGEDARALEAYARLAAEWPASAEVLNNIGVLQVRTGRLTDARQTFEQALRTSAPHAQAFDNLRQIYAELAARAYAQALQEPWKAADARNRYRMISEPPAALAAPPTPVQAAQPALAQDDSPRRRDIAPTLADRTETLIAQPANLMGATMHPPSSSRAEPSVNASPSAQTQSRRLLPAIHAGWLGSNLFGRDDSAAAPVPGAASGAATGMGWQFSLSRLASVTLLLAMLVVLAMAAVQSRAAKPGGKASVSVDSSQMDSTQLGTLPLSAEARLIEIYGLIGAADARGALAHAESLINDSPNFQLAQLVYGDLLLAQGMPLDSVGQGAGKLVNGAQLPQLKQEAIKRLHALRAAPPIGTVPSAFVQVAANTRHAVAVDATHSRLYVFENRASGLVLASSHYIATGRQGLGKRREGDQRTPLGVYFISGRLDARDLDDFYGVGALPLNYPNEHDRRHGRTGADIWLHGTPAAQHSPLPDSTGGCIVLANDDLRQLWRELTPLNTPVVIARHLDWVTPASLATQKRELLGVLDSWRLARSAGDLQRAMSFYSVDFKLGDASPAESRRHVERELAHAAARERELHEVTVLSWQDEGDRAVVSFTENIRGSRKAVMHRQYWNHEQGHWKLYSEGVLE
ncbi:MAG: hypothetical protein RIQ60_851 [Pseudomonadota bacterium]|jgi:murein L,D-transpeptidase YafK/tetratricopeptide (TPR) repeat protein